MKKKIYCAPIIEVENIRFNGALLSSPDSSSLPQFPHPGSGAPARRGTVQVF